MAITAKKTDKTVTISINGRFDFSSQRDFREAYRHCNDAGQLFQVDMSQTEYMDSSALGMLLLLKEHAETCKGRAEIRNPSPQVRKILEMVNFDRQFVIS